MCVCVRFIAMRLCIARLQRLGLSSFELRRANTYRSWQAEVEREQLKNFFSLKVTNSETDNRLSLLQIVLIYFAQRSFSLVNFALSLSLTFQFWPAKLETMPQGEWHWRLVYRMDCHLSLPLPLRQPARYYCGRIFRILVLRQESIDWMTPIRRA